MTRTIRSVAPVQPMIGDDDPFGGSNRSPYLMPNGEPDFAAIQDSPEFKQLRRQVRRYVFPVSVVFLAWYMAYVLFAAYDHSLMDYKLVGEINVGLVWGVLQFVSTILITVSYMRYARRKIDPEAEAVRGMAGANEE